MSTTTTTTATSSPSISSSISAGSLSCRAQVRFDDECVLIPEPKRPIMVTKFYPLWRKRHASPDSSENSIAVEDASLSPEATHVVLKVPVPSFMTRSRSNSHSRSPDSSPKQPLSPCLIHRSSSLQRPGRRELVRGPSLSSTDHDGNPIVTVPLRPCCSKCYPITEESLRAGDDWVEKFSRGARRRRMSSSSLDGFTPSIPHLSRLPEVSPCRSGHKEPAVSFKFQNPLSITVDEVDKRRKSADYDLGDASTSSIDPPLSPLTDTPIMEEDEEELFPLPSPRRSPSASPISSPLPSPNASTHDIATFSSDLEEIMLPQSLSRTDKFEKDIRPSMHTTASTPIMVPSSSRHSNNPISPRETHPYHARRPSIPYLDDDDSEDIKLFGWSDSTTPPSTPPPPSSPFKMHLHFPTKDTLLQVGAGVLKGVSSLTGGR